MSLWLTDDELEGLTGYRRKSDQVRWLQQNGITHTVRADGRARVPLHAYTHQAEQRTTPDFEALKRTG